MFHSLLSCRIRHEQPYAALFRTVKPGAAMSDPLSGKRSEQLAGGITKMKRISIDSQNKSAHSR